MAYVLSNGNTSKIFTAKSLACPGGMDQKPDQHNRAVLLNHCHTAPTYSQKIISK